MRALTETHQGNAPQPVHGDPTPRQQRLLDLAEQPTRFPSDAFVRAGCVTKAEWERRHALTYGGAS